MDARANDRVSGSTVDERGTRVVLPAFSSGDGALPAPESPHRRFTVRASALVALALSVAYLTWRVGFTMGTLWLAIPLWLLEVHAVLGLGLFSFSLWDLDASAIPAPVESSDRRVAVLIPTYNEPAEVLLPTIAAAAALRPAHETWVLDDGERPWVAALAETLGAHYLAREDHSHAKAGNLNHAIEHLDAEFVAVLDADHVASLEFLTHTLGYFDDPSIAIVQTPQDFYNVDSFEHGPNRSWFWRHRRATAFNEQRLFYRAIQPGKNRWGGGLLVRHQRGGAHERAARSRRRGDRDPPRGHPHLDPLHRRGWRTVYHNEVLARGLAARDAEQYQTQRLRWGTGAMQLLHLEHPITGRGLTVGQRVAYAATVLGWFDAWRTLGYVLVPLAVVFSGASPIHASAVTFALAFGVTLLAQRLAIALLSRGYAPAGLATLFEFVRLQTTMAATMTYLRGAAKPFRVTAKGGADERRRGQAPWLLWLLLALSVAAGAWFVATLAGLTPVTYPVRWTVYGAVFWALVNAGLLVAAIRRIRSDRFATDRRTGVRQRLEGEALVDGGRAHLLDVSIGGALVRTRLLATASQHHLLALSFDGDQTVRLDCDERSRQSLGAEGDLVSLQFRTGQDREIGRLAVALFGARPLTGHAHRSSSEHRRAPRRPSRSPVSHELIDHHLD